MQLQRTQFWAMAVIIIASFAEVTARGDDSPGLISWRAYGEIFPERWVQPPSRAAVEPVAERQKRRAQRLVNGAVAKYRKRRIENLLNRV